MYMYQDFRKKQLKTVLLDNVLLDKFCWIVLLDNFTVKGM